MHKIMLREGDHREDSEKSNMLMKTEGRKSMGQEESKSTIYTVLARGYQGKSMS